ncbi:TraB/GumN family protein [Vibrio taketomensis]|uniref:TraB/GumN family protein n=1 Tax=Vibrio taketomensis TaxID=2572923 RepID=UPI001389A8E7|nr:TraB/GumN family protein [Vibrio taketomensis]
MKNFRWLALLLMVASSVSAEPLYWQASKGNLNYLIVGSVHVGDDSMYPLPVNVTTFLQHSDGIVLEADIRHTGNVRYPIAQKTTAQVLDQQGEQELTGIAHLLGLDPQALLLSPPWASALTVQIKQMEYLGYKPQDGVDVQLMSMAASQNKPVYSLESLQFQIDLLANLDNDGEELLTSAVEQFDHNEGATHCLIESWKRGDSVKLQEFAKLGDMSPKMENDFIYQRNHDWADKLSKATMFPERRGNYLVVVGTLHLVGRDNLPLLLKQRGFNVTQRSKSETATCEFKY